MTAVSQNYPILLANLLQSSRSTFSWRSFLSFFACKEGMVDTQISALGGWPTVSDNMSRHWAAILLPQQNLFNSNFSEAAVGQ
jgi:hypothetical protein